MGYTVVDPTYIISAHLTEVIRNHIAELLTRQDVQNLVDNMKETNPALVDELVPKFMTLGEIEKVLQNLLSDGISIRDLVTIFEILVNYAALCLKCHFDPRSQLSFLGMKSGHHL